MENELLTVLVTPPSTTATSNAQHTIHQGIEASVNTVLWQSDPVVETKKSHSGDTKEIDAPEANDDSNRRRILLRQDYTWSLFRYDNDPVYSNNQLPGVPEHFYQAELRYEDPSGFYVGVNTEAVISSYEGDFANTITVHPYAIMGATIGYEQKGFSVFFKVDNITNDKYAASISPTFNAKGADSGIYSPGVLQSFTGGVSYKF